MTSPKRGQSDPRLRFVTECTVEDEVLHLAWIRVVERKGISWGMLIFR